MFKTNYSSFTSRRSNGGAEEKRERQGETQFMTKIEVPLALLNANVFLFF
jgi:hypothetical protein